MPTPVLQTTIPSPHAAAFTAGEVGLAVSSPSSATPARTTYHLTRWFDFDGGTYTIKSYAKDAAQWYVGPTRDNARFLFSQLDAQGVSSNVVYLPAGRQRITIVLSNLQSAAANTLVAFSISKAGRTIYVSAAGGWVFDTTPIADSAVPPLGDPRLALRVFNFRPNWAEGVVERVSFVTEVLTSETDMEQRRALRRYPRRSFEASFLRTKRDRSRLQSFLTGIGRDWFLVPLWHDQWTLQASFSLTIQFPTGTATMREFQPGTLALLSGRDTTVHEIVQVETVNALTDQVTFSRPQTPLTWDAGSRLTPLRVAKITDTAQMEHPTDSVGLTTLRFDLRDPDTYVVPDWRYCVPLWQFPLNWSTPVNLDFNRLTFDLDNDTSLPDSVSPGERTRIGVRAGLTLRGRSNVYGLRQFITSARGRQVSFWFPTTLNDLQPVSDLSGNYFDVQKSGVGEFVNTPQDVHRQVMIRFKGEERPPVFRTVTSVEELLSVERVFVAVPLPAIGLAEIEEVSFVLPVRFEQDSFELRHLVDDSSAVQSTVVVRSTDVGDLPPIECVVTSQIYPVEAIEGVTLGLTLTGARFSGVRMSPEGVTLGLNLLDGELVGTVFRQYNNYAPEAVTLGLNLTGGTLADAVVSYDNYAPEAVTLGFNLTGGTLKNGLITYQNYAPEGVNLSFTLTSGTLT